MSNSESEELRILISNYKNDPIGHEKVSSGRLIFKYGVIFPGTKAVGLPVCAYIRGLDDLIDTGREVKPVISLLQEERTALLKQRKLSKLQEESFGDVREKVPSNLWQAIVRDVGINLNGFMVDAQTRLCQKPPDIKLMLTRDYGVLWPALAIINIAWFKFDPGTGGKGLELLKLWAEYDNISDIGEDLEHGLQLIPRELQTKYRLSFEDGQFIPTRELKDYYYGERKRIAHGLIKHSKDIFSLGLDQKLSLFAYFYFLTRILKLGKPFPVRGDVKYSAPSDCVIAGEKKV